MEQLEEFLSKQAGEEMADDVVKNYYLVIEEDYASNNPGYCGKMLLGVYGAPEIYQLYGWIGGKLVEIGHNRGVR